MHTCDIDQLPLEDSYSFHALQCPSVDSTETMHFATSSVLCNPALVQRTGDHGVRVLIYLPNFGLENLIFVNRIALDGLKVPSEDKTFIRSLHRLMKSQVFVFRMLPIPFPIPISCQVVSDHILIRQLIATPTPFPLPDPE